MKGKQAIIPTTQSILPHNDDYKNLLSGISGLLEQARRTSARSVNAVLTATYWEVGRRIVEYEQLGKERAEYGDALVRRLANDLYARFGRGFSKRNVDYMRAFYLAWEIVQTPSAQFEARAKCPTLSGKSEDKKVQTLSAKSFNKSLDMSMLMEIFPLSWSHYVHLMSVENSRARAFYEAEAIRGGWSVRQLDRQISTQYFERVVHSKNPDALIAHGQHSQTGELLDADEEIRDPYILEFLNLKDEYSETDLEDALVRHMEHFLLEMGNGFTFVARQKRIRVGSTWFKIDLVLFNRILHCLVFIDLKRGEFTHADAGQMNLYLNYAKEHLMLQGESDPVGIILCRGKDDAVVKYAMGGIRAKVFASKYMTTLPDVETLRMEIVSTQRAIQKRMKRK